MNKLPKRKHPRLKNYDYSQNGFYFVTVCVAVNSVKLSKVYAKGENGKPEICLSEIGKTVEKQILRIPEIYKTVSVEKYIILPNHLHLLFHFDNLNGGIWESRPTKINPQLSTVIRGFKSMVTREIGQSIWQKSFYEEVINSDDHYQCVWQYIDANAQKWLEKHTQ